MYTFQDLIEDVNARIVDESEGTVTGDTIKTYTNTALRRIRRRTGLPNSEYVTSFPLFRSVYRYPLPVGYKDYAGIYSQFVVNDPLRFTKIADEKKFWQSRPLGTQLVCDARDGQNRYLLVDLASMAPGLATVQDCNTFDGNGTWTANIATSDANNVATDHQFFRDGSGSVKFDIIVGQSINSYAEIFNSTFTPVDLSSTGFANIGTMFMWVFIPNAVNYTSFTLRWGSSPTDYYEQTVTQQYCGSAIVPAWNELGFDWVTATKVGNPNNAAINYLLFRSTFPATGFASQTGLRIDSIRMCQKFYANLHWESDYQVIEGDVNSPNYLQPKPNISSATDTSSFFNCDSSFTDYILSHVLIEVFTHDKPNQMALEKAKEEFKEIEADLVTRFPDRREMPTDTWMDDERLDDALRR